MVVEVVHPHPGRLPAGLLAHVGAGVEHLVGQQPVEPLHFAVVPGRVGTDPLVPAGQGLHAPGEVPGLVVGAVVGDDPVDLLNAVGGEERSCSAEEPDRRHRPLILEGLGVGQSREAVHGRVQVGVAGLRSGPALGCLDSGGSAAVGPPAAAVGDASDLLYVQVHHVPGPPRPDPLGWASQVVPVRGEVTQPGDPQPVQPPAHGPQVQLVPETEQVAVDASGGPLPFPPQALDELHDGHRGALRAAPWD